MKTFFIGMALTLICFFTSAQEQRTSFDEISVVTTATGIAAQLTWKKGTENISYFIIERSTDGIDFKQCGIVFLSEDPQLNEYRFRERISNISSGLVYRIGVVTNQKRVFYLPSKKLVSPNSI
jgi:ABC-type Na+ transport system ATPase subunit NatA